MKWEVLFNKYSKPLPVEGVYSEQINCLTEAIENWLNNPDYNQEVEFLF